MGCLELAWQCVAARLSGRMSVFLPMVLPSQRKSIRLIIYVIFFVPYQSLHGTLRIIKVHCKAQSKSIKMQAVENAVLLITQGAMGGKMRSYVNVSGHLTMQASLAYMAQWI